VLPIDGLRRGAFPCTHSVLRYCDVKIHRTAHKHEIDDDTIRHAIDQTRGGRAMTNPTTRRTRSGRALTDEDLETLATEVAEKDYDVDVLKKRRRRGRPPMGSGPADVVPVRIDPELLAAIEARAEADHATTSEIIREAIRRFLDVA
jgi:hypothetical protein